MKNFRKKYTLTIAVFLTGTILAFATNASLGEYTYFAAVLLSTFGAADVADKKFNGGVYDGRQRDRTDRQGAGADSK